MKSHTQNAQIIYLNPTGTEQVTISTKVSFMAYHKFSHPNARMIRLWNTLEVHALARGTSERQLLRMGASWNQR